MSIVHYGQDYQGYITGTGGLGLIVIQEWWGLTPQLKNISDRFAKDGPFTVLAPDLYHGKIAEEALEAEHLMSALDWMKALDEIKAAKDYLLQEKKVTSVAITGFCMGGALTLFSISKTSGFSAGVCFYGIPTGFKAEGTSCPVQLHFGEQDDVKGFSDYETAKNLESQFKAAKKPAEFFYYSTGHSFMNRESPKYHEPSAKVAYQRTIEFIHKNAM